MGVQSVLVDQTIHTMKLIALTLVAVVALASAANEFVSKKEATNLLDNQENARFRRAATGKSMKKLQKKWKNICKFNSVEKWTEFKDELEETDLPEKEVDALESCTFRCNRKDEALDFVGKAYEENREKQEEKGTKFVPACKQ